MSSIIRYTLLTAIRDWLFMGIFLLILISVVFSAFLGNTSLVEQKEMTAAYIAGTTRIITITGLILFVCFHVRRSFENKEVELILSRPISRSSFIIGYFLAFATLAFAIALPIISLLYALDCIGYITLNTKGLFIWGVSLYLETLIMISLSFFAALLMRSAVTSVMFCFGFYFLARIFGYFLISINNPASVMKSSTIGSFSEKLLDVMGVLFPRLDMLSKSEWLIYGIESQERIGLFLSASVIYIPIILLMSIFDFSRKQF